MALMDVIVPIKNEAPNLEKLVFRIHESLTSKKIDYLLIFVDDHSTDSSVKILKTLSRKYPIVVRTKIGTPGKAFSILEGATVSNAGIVAMIDGDLQYPPEALPEMYKILEADANLGVVVANRKKSKTSFLRRIPSSLSRFLVGRTLLGFNCDIQSGLKIFRREIIGYIGLKDLSAWSIDVPLLHTARELGYSLETVDIEFSERTKGQSKIRFFDAARQIAWNGVKVRFSGRKIYPIEPENKSMIGAGLVYKKNRFITHTTLRHNHSALQVLSQWQKVGISAFLIGLIFSLIFNPLSTMVVLISVLSTIYFIDTLFNLGLVLKSLHFPPELTFSSEEISSLDDDKLPIYTVLCPLYKESEILPQFLASIENIDWPKNKLDVILLLEEDDTKSVSVIGEMKLPKYIRTVVVPNSQPKTKPKACNYGLAMAKGEYVVIYDAEDRPDRDQLKKAYLGFESVADNVGCLQAKLNYYNPSHNLLTRLFSAEYSLWFDVILTGLQSIETVIPLGGTSNHFKTKLLQKLEGWDPFNVTEDCDLGVRLFKQGYRTAIIDSVTLEEANSKVGNWVRQRSRWIKGYIQTYLVHMRNPMELVKTQGWHALLFQLTIGGKLAFIFINPLLWIATIAYFVLYKYVGPTIESLYPTWVFYMAAFSLVFGNFSFLYFYMIGSAKRDHWSIIKFVFLIPVYWLMVSIAGFKGGIQLIFKPHYWEKTVHGLDKKIAKEAKQVIKFQLSEKFGWVKKITESTLVSGSFLIIANMLGNFFGFLYNAYLGRSASISISDFGLISLIGSFLYISQIATSALSRTITYRSAYLLGEHKTAVGKFWSYVRSKIIPIAVMITIFWFIAIPALAQYFHSGIVPFVLFSPIWIITFLFSVDAGFLGGNQKFSILALINLLESINKFVATYIFIKLGYTEYIYAALPISLSISFVMGWVLARSLVNKSKKIEVKESSYFPKRFFITSVISKLSDISFLSLDLILAKIFLSPELAGQYALIALVGKMIYLVGNLFAQFTTPVISKKLGAGEDTNKIFYKLLTAVCLSSVIAFVCLGIFGQFSAPLLFGAKSLSILVYLPWYCFAMVCFTVASTIINYHQVRKEYLFPVVGFLLSICLIIGLILFHGSLDAVIKVMFIFGCLYILVITLLHIFYGPTMTILRNSIDFLGLFLRFNKQRGSSKKLNILIFNWRDTKHIWAGGAEVYVHELAKRWVLDGHKVTIFCGNDGKTIRNDVMDGVQIIRRGGFYTVYIWAFLYYILKLRGLFDVVVDSENGVPFFTPFYVRKPKFLLIHHIHQEVFRSQLRWPASWVAMFIESKLMPLAYSHSKVITVSESSKKDIIKLGLSKENDIEVINPGIDLVKFHATPKTNYPSFLYLGRIRPYKNIDVAIRALKSVVKKYPTTKLTIAGWGESLPKLKQLVIDLNLSNSVIFAEKVSEEEKIKLLGQSWAMIQPSSFEGWGITVIEANACNTPVIASDVIGLRDSVLHGETGLLVPVSDEKALSVAMTELIVDKDKLATLTKNSYKWAYNFDWSNISTSFLESIQTQLIKGFTLAV